MKAIKAMKVATTALLPHTAAKKAPMKAPAAAAKKAPMKAMKAMKVMKATATAPMQQAMNDEPSTQPTYMKKLPMTYYGPNGGFWRCTGFYQVFQRVMAPP